jgi:beta-glucosidase-like glycosyl hydrolase
LKPYEGVSVDFAVYRIMYQLFDKGVLDTPRDNNIDKDIRTQKAADLSRIVAEQSMVLLKNDRLPHGRSVLHLDDHQNRNINIVCG